MNKPKTGMKAFISLDGNGRVVIEMYPQPQQGSFVGPYYNLEPAFPLIALGETTNIISSETGDCITKASNLEFAIKTVFKRYE